MERLDLTIDSLGFRRATMLTASHSGTWSKVDDVIGGTDRVFVVLDHDDGVADDLASVPSDL